MPIFDVEHNGKTYEIDAPDMAAAMAALAPPARKMPDLLSMMDPYGGGVDMSDPATQAATMRATKGAAGSIVRAPVNFAEGAGQLVNWVGNKVGLVPDADVKAYDDAVKQSREDFKKAGGEPLVSEALAGLAPVGAATKLAGGVKYGRALLKALAAGGLAGGTQFSENGEKASQVAWGAAFPAAAQAIGGVKGAVVNSVKSIIDNAQKARTRSVVQGARAFFGGSKAVESPAPYTVAQMSGSANVARLENRARGKELMELNARQLDDVSKRFNELADEAGRMSARATTREAFEATKELTDAAKRQKNKMWNDGIDEFHVLAAKSRTGIRLDNMKAEYAKIAEEDANVFSLEGGVIGNEAKNALAALAKMPATAKLKIAILPTIMKGLSQGANNGRSALLSGEDATRAMYRNRLFKALEEDLDEAGVVGDPALDQLQAVRSRYRAASEKLERLEDSNLNKLFGSKEALANPRSAVTSFLRLPPGDQEYTIRVLNQRAPAVVGAMRSQLIADALEGATENTAANAARLNIDKFNAALFGGSDGVKGSRLFDPVLKKRVLEGAAHLRVLQNNLPRGNSGGSVIWPEEAAINIVSRSPEFVARSVTRAVYGSQGDKLLGTEEGLKALRTLVNVKADKSQGAAAAMAYVLNLIQTDDGQ